MRKILPLCWVALLCSQALHAQEYTHLLRLYEDNDFFNIRGLGTDEAYTNGSRIDLFYRKNTPDKFPLNKVLLKAGHHAINVYGWSATQLMYTPRNIRTTVYQPGDYAYAGALFVTRSLYSYSEAQHYDLQTECIIGLRGAPAGAHETQSFLHHMIGYQQPMGWQHQLDNQLLVNINIKGEKLLAQWGRAVEIMAGAQVYGGTMFSGASVFPLVRIGKMHPYFQGFIQQYSSDKTNGARCWKRLQAYLVFRPEVQAVLYDAMLEGKLPGDAGKDGQVPQVRCHSWDEVEHMVYALNCGAVISLGAFTLTYTQHTATAQLKHGYSHEYGNLSLGYAFR